MDSQVIFAGVLGVSCFAVELSRVLASTGSEPTNNEAPGLARSLLLFAYSHFLQPYRGDGKGTQQDALESSYKTQAAVHDNTGGPFLKA